MSERLVDKEAKSAILEDARSMATGGVQSFKEPQLNALDLAGKMGISLETLSQAIDADVIAVKEKPRAEHWQKRLRVVADLWENLLILFGNEEDARLFLNKPRPELKSRTPLYYLENGRPNVVLNLVFSIREMLP